MSGRHVNLQNAGRPGSRTGDGEVQSSRQDVRRLVVLVPDQGADGVDLARQIWALAEPCELPVLFLCALKGGDAREAAARLRLATLAAQVRDDHIAVNTIVMSNRSWVVAVRQQWQDGDLVLCCADQTVPTVYGGRQLLCHVLESALGIPVFVLAGLYTEAPAAPGPWNDRLARYVHWALLAALVIAFSVAEVQADQSIIGLPRALILLAMGVLEVGMIVAWIKQA